jgi:DNA-directed RNA polymerase specialized sigma24 family protein
VQQGDALATLHREHYTSLVRLAALVVGDRGVAEQLTQDAFVKLHLRWGGLRRLDRAPAYCAARC